MPWSGAEVVAVFITVMLMIPLAVAFLFRPQDLPDFWFAAMSFPLQFGAIVMVLRFTSDTRPYQLGLTIQRAANNASLGYFFWLVLTPLAYLIEFAAVLVYPDLYGHGPAEHPLFQALKKHPDAIDWLVAFLVAIVVAPLLEETLFRGVLQPWLTRRPRGPDAALFASFAVAAAQTLGPFEKAWAMHQDPERWSRVLEAISPAFFVAAMIPGCRLTEFGPWKWLPHLRARRAIYSTALLFAAIHSFAWPSPIPLFVLGLGLGYLAYRTQSLVGCITLHALFNAVACFGDLISYLAHTA